MRPQQEQAAAGPSVRPTPKRRVYDPPKLERLGTIRELTQGLGMNNAFDGGHSPGQNKSTL